MAQTDRFIEWLTFLVALVAWGVYHFLGYRHSKKEEAIQAGEPLRKWTGRYMPWNIAVSCLWVGTYSALTIFLFAGLEYSSPNLASLVLLSNLPILWMQFIPRRESLEICANGIAIYRKGTGNFVPWAKMECVRVSQAKGSVVIDEPGCRWRPYFIPPDDIDEAITILRRFVHVRDRAGQLLNPELPLGDKARTPAAAPRRWQFSLRSALLIMVLASCTMSWWVIHHRRESIQDELLVKLQPFGMSAVGSDRSMLILASVASASSYDDALKVAARWPGLVELEVVRTNVTDTGLEYLKDMPTLQRLDIRGTKVTAQGVDKLQRALPGCKIISDFGSD